MVVGSTTLGITVQSNLHTMPSGLEIYQDCFNAKHSRYPAWMYMALGRQKPKTELLMTKEWITLVEGQPKRSKASTGYILTTRKQYACTCLIEINIQLEGIFELLIEIKCY